MAYAIELPDGTWLLVLDPQPIFQKSVWRAFWDGQPRTSDGRFTYGKRTAVAASTGITGKVTVKEAVKMLSHPFLASDPRGRKIIFDSFLIGKYRDGQGRKSKDEDRLRSLGMAVLAVQKMNGGMVRLEKHNPPQVQYLHKFGLKKAIVVYVEENTGRVRGFIYSSHKNADRFLDKKRGR